MEKKVFGYPSFNEQGEKILTTYDNEYADMLMDIRVYRMKSGEMRTFLREGEEVAVLLLGGKITFSWEGNAKTVSNHGSSLKWEITTTYTSNSAVTRSKDNDKFSPKKTIAV